MIYNIWCRMMSALHVLFVRRVMVIEKRFDLEKKLHRIDLWTTIADKQQKITILRELANSLERELCEEKICTLGNKSPDHASTARLSE
jgi:hypothetical protein